MASKPAKSSRATGRSRARSVNERHFEGSKEKPSARHARKPIVALDGARIVSVTYPGLRENGTDLVLGADELNEAPNIIQGLVAAFTRTLRANRPKRQVQQYWGYLSEFALCIAEMDPAVTFATLDRKHLTAFRTWLDKRNAAGITRRSKATRSTAIMNVQLLLKSTGQCGHVDFLKRPYVSADGTSIRRVKRKSARPVPRPEVTRLLLQAVLREMQATMTLRAAFLHPNHPALEDADTRKAITLARQIKDRHGCKLPDKKTLAQLVQVNAERGQDRKVGAKTAIPAIMPTKVTIAPFCILLMIALRLDGQMLADLLQKNVKVVEHIGVERLQATSWRSKVKEWKTTTATLSGHWHSPEKLIEFLNDWMEDLREIAPEKIKGRQFILASLGAARGVKAMNHKEGIGRAITDFCKRNGLPRITSSIPRKLAIDLADMLSQGDIGIRAQAGVHDQEMSLAHYDTTEAAGRGDDAYGVGVMLLTAHRRDHGRTPDKRTYMPDEDVMAATPGWWCSNPFDPPAGSGESGRRPCAAYGMCPACPNGEPDLSDPVSCKRTGLLLDAVLRSEPNMPPEVWEGTWKPVADELAFKYIPMFEALPEVTAAAALLDIGPMDDAFALLEEMGDGNWPFAKDKGTVQWERERLRMLVIHLKHTNAMPLLLALRELGSTRFAEAVAMLERFVFRYKTIGNAHISPMTELYLKHAKKIRDDPATYKMSGLRADLTALADKMVPLDLFEASLRQLRYNKRSGNWHIRYMLIALEDYRAWFDKGSNGVPKCRNKSAILDFPNTTLEHVYPRSAKTAEKDATLEPLKDTLGNLAVFGPEDNDSLANKPFADKKAMLAKSNISLNRDVGALPSWTSKALNDRTNSLISMALKIFVP